MCRYLINSADWMGSKMLQNMKKMEQNKYFVLLSQTKRQIFNEIKS